MLRDHNCLIEGFSFTDLNFVFLDSVSFNFEENRYPLGAVVDRMNKYRREMQVLKCPWHHRVIDIKFACKGCLLLTDMRPRDSFYINLFAVA